MTAHRALPLVVVEEQARAARKPWPSCAGAGCNQGRTPDACDCRPAEVGQWSEFHDEPAREEMDGFSVSLLTVGVIVSAAFSAWFICTFGQQIEPVLVALLDVLP
jgi:hypothetical protein